MLTTSDKQANQSGQTDRLYEQRWQAHLSYEMRTRLALEQQHKEEEVQSYLYEINLADRALLVARQEAERKALLQQHRAMRIALRKGYG